MTEPIGRHPTDRLKMAVRPDGRNALSVVHRVASDGRLSLIAVLIRTGRTHQIRAHMRHLRCPILGDPMYGDTTWNKKEARRADRPLLHAYSIRFAHPTSGEVVQVEAAPPPDISHIGAELAGVSEDDFAGWLSSDVERRLSYSLEDFVFVRDTNS